jgi:hypothetical protein
MSPTRLESFKAELSQMKRAMEGVEGINDL